MLVQEKQILPTDNTPQIVLNPEGGIIKIKGRFIKEYKSEYSEEIIEWIEEYSKNPAEISCVDIYLEYVNGYNSIILTSILRKLLNVKLKNKNLIINWYYEEGDEDILEQGEYLSSILGIVFNYIMIRDRVNP